MKDLTRGNIYKTFFLFGFPMVLSGLLSQMYGIIDTSIAGKLIGETGLAATGVTSPLTTFLSSVYWGYGTGFSIYIAKLFGAKEYGKIRRAVAVSFAIQIAFTAVMAAVCLGFHKQIFNLLNVDETLREEAYAYYSVYVAGLCFIVFNNSFLSILNAFGISGFQLWMSVAATVLNIGGNIFLVKIGMGVRGLALSSVFAGVAVDICYIFKLRACYKEMGTAGEKFSLKTQGFRESFAYALPNMAQQMVMYLSSLLLSPLVNGLGKEAPAAYSVALTLFNLIAAVFGNSAKALSNYTAQCMGLKKYDRIKKGLGAGALQGLAFSLPFLLVCAFFPEAVCSLFFKPEASAVTKNYAILFARVYAPLMFLYGTNNLFHALFRGTKASVCLFTSTFWGAAVRYVASALLIAKAGMNGFYLGWAISWAAEAVYAIILYLTNVWNPARKEAAAAAA